LMKELEQLPQGGIKPATSRYRKGKNDRQSEAGSRGVSKRRKRP
jgi:hypothetical protein